MRRHDQSGAGIGRRAILHSASAFAAWVFALRSAAAEPTPDETPKLAWLTFTVDEIAAEKFLNAELRDRVQRLCGALKLALKGPPLVMEGEVLAPLAQVDDVAALVAALPAIDPTIRPAFEPSEGLSATPGPDGVVRIALTERARNSRAQLWRDRARLTFARALSSSFGPGVSALPLPDGESFVLTFDRLTRARWQRWIGGRVDLFVFGKFSIAPLAASPAVKEKIEYPRSWPEGAPMLHVAIDGGKWVDRLDDMVVARVEGEGDGERLILQWTRPGVAELDRQALPTGDKTAMALMFDRALAATVELDGAATDGVMRCRVKAGLGARRLSELILQSGSLPPLKLLDAHFV